MTTASHVKLWPPRNRDPDDIALVAVRMLAATGELRSRLRRSARRMGIAPDILTLLLLFTDSSARLRPMDVAERLGISRSSASRLTARAERARLIQRCDTVLDERAMPYRLTRAGTLESERALEVLRADARAVLHPPDVTWPRSATALLASTYRMPPSSSRGYRAGGRIPLD